MLGSGQRQTGVANVAGAIQFTRRVLEGAICLILVFTMNGVNTENSQTFSKMNSKNGIIE